MTTTATARSVDPDKLMAFVFRAVDEVGADAEHRARRDGRPARLLPGARRRRPDAPRPSWPSAPAPASTTPGSGSTPRPPAATSATTRRPAATRCRPSTPSRSPTRPARRSCPGFFQIALRHGPRRRPASSTRPRARRRARLARPQRRRARRLRAVLPARLPRATWSPSGCPRSTASSTSSTRGARVADIGCGHGASTILMAQAFPALEVRRLRLPRASRSTTARERAAEAGVADRVDVRGRRRATASPAPATTW